VSAALNKKSPFMFRNTEKLAAADQGQLPNVISKLEVHGHQN